MGIECGDFFNDLSHCQPLTLPARFDFIILPVLIPLSRSEAPVVHRGFAHGDFVYTYLAEFSVETSFAFDKSLRSPMRLFIASPVGGLLGQYVYSRLDF